VLRYQEEEGRVYQSILLVKPDAFLYIGAGPKGKYPFDGVVDDIRIASRRRYNIRQSWRGLDTDVRPIPFGPPLFKKDARIVHADFESRQLPVHPQDQSKLLWDIDKHVTFSDFQVDAPFGKGLLLDPVMGFPRIPIKGMSIREGTFEMWLQPVNWDNNSGFGHNISWSKLNLSVARFRGRDKRTGEMVTFMEVILPRGYMGGGQAALQPGQWKHLVWSWSPDFNPVPHPVAGSNKPRRLHAYSMGESRWRLMIFREMDLLDHVEPLYLELGVTNDVEVYHGQRPAVMIDEVILHSEALTHEQREKATRLWAEKYMPADHSEKPVSP
jgi:hypothetical protein